jgi:hypothetical protein
MQTICLDEGGGNGERAELRSGSRRCSRDELQVTSVAEAIGQETTTGRRSVRELCITPNFGEYSW